MRTVYSEIKRQKRRLSDAEADLMREHNPRAMKLFVNVASELYALEAFANLPNKERLSRLDIFKAGFRAYRDYKEGKTNEPVQTEDPAAVARNDNG